MRWLIAAVPLLFGASVGHVLAQTQAQPAVAPTAREIQLVVPAEPGGNMSDIAQLLAKALDPLLPQSVVVVYRSGASGNIGASVVSRSEPDGRMLLVAGSNFLVTPLLVSDSGYDPMRDFEPIARIAVAPNVLLVNATLRGITLEQLLRKPAQEIAYASGGHGGSSHLATEQFMAKTGVHWLHVPYRGTGPALRALLGGEVQLMFTPAGPVGSAVATGRVVPLAVANPTRLPSLPDTPTLAELGVKEAEYSQWYGVFAPAGTPASLCERLSELVLHAFQDPALRERLQASGVETATLGRREFAAFLAADQRRLVTLLKNVGAATRGK